MTFRDVGAIVRGTNGIATPPWLDVPLLVAELGARQLYWRSDALRTRLAPVRAPAAPLAPLTVARDALLERLTALGVQPGALVMVHSSLEHLAVAGGQATAATGAALGAMLLGDLQGLVTATGTIAIPTHPFYREDPGYFHDKRDLVVTYDPRRTPSRVGLLGELFRRTVGVERSLHPLSSLAAKGPRAAELLHNNLNDAEPLPHGVHSGYHAFCRAGGTVISINTPLIKAISIAHTAEEVRDHEWPVRGFFYPRRFKLRTADGEREVTVRERHPMWARNISLGQLRRDLLREGLLRETDVGGVRVDCADAAGVLEYMMRRNARGPYPYYGTVWL